MFNTQVAVVLVESYNSTGRKLQKINEIKCIFKVCKSVHHHTFQINQPTRCNNLSSLLLTFIYSSTCFGRPCAHHQELNNCSNSLWFYLRSVVIAVQINVSNKLDKLLYLVG